MHSFWKVGLETLVVFAASVHSNSWVLSNPYFWKTLPKVGQATSRSFVSNVLWHDQSFISCARSLAQVFVIEGVGGWVKKGKDLPESVAWAKMAVPHSLGVPTHPPITHVSHMFVSSLLLKRILLACPANGTNTSQVAVVFVVLFPACGKSSVLLSWAETSPFARFQYHKLQSCLSG